MALRGPVDILEVHPGEVQEDTVAKGLQVKCAHG